jgi:hypothetical protein
VKFLGEIIIGKPMFLEELEIIEKILSKLNREVKEGKIKLAEGRNILRHELNEAGVVRTCSIRFERESITFHFG